MPKHKYGKHAASLSSDIRESMRRLEDLDGVGRVIVGYIRGGRGKAREHGYIHVQRVDANVLYAIAYGDRLFELSIIPTGDVPTEIIAAAIKTMWPPELPLNSRKRKKHKMHGPKQSTSIAASA